MWDKCPHYRLTTQHLRGEVSRHLVGLENFRGNKKKTKGIGLGGSGKRKKGKKRTTPPEEMENGEGSSAEEKK